MITHLANEPQYRCVRSSPKQRALGRACSARRMGCPYLNASRHTLGRPRSRWTSSLRVFSSNGPPSSLADQAQYSTLLDLLDIPLNEEPLDVAPLNGEPLTLLEVDRPLLRHDNTTVPHNADSDHEFLRRSLDTATEVEDVDKLVFVVEDEVIVRFEEIGLMRTEL